MRGICTRARSSASATPRRFTTEATAAGSARRGFRYGLLDVLALARSLSKDEDVPQALRRFENERLSDDRELVLSGLAWGKQYLKGEA